MLRIGVAQIGNHFQYGLNLQSILKAIDYHSAQGADLVLFPECAITGYNTGIKDIDEEGILTSLRTVQDAARAKKITVALPTPYPRGDGKFHNSVLIVNEQGEIAHTFHKIGFQVGEERFFVPGQPHSRSFELKGYKVGVVICIETTNPTWTYLKKDEPVDFVYWPGFYAQKNGETWSDSTSEDDVQVRKNIAEWKVPAIQVTCASSPESEYWLDHSFGGSIIADSTGRQIFSARRSKEDMVLIEFDRKNLRIAKSGRKL